MRSGALAAAMVSATAFCATNAANPIIPGWYADPEIRIFGKRYWIYPTYSDDYGAPDRSTRFTDAQKRLRERWATRPATLPKTFFNAFSSPDLVHWTKHEHVLDVRDVSWAAYAVWAPSVIASNGHYYMFFSANDIQKDSGEPGGIGVARSRSPGGPFVDAIGKPLIGAFHNGAQPIDPFAFRDDDGITYLYYGGQGHCNVVRLSADLTRIVPFADGSIFKEITPARYVEGPFVIKRRGYYYLMWSEGSWTDSSYSVAYARSRSPLGPFERIGGILRSDPTIANGTGHHSVINIPGSDDWYIVYHRRPVGDDVPTHRELAMERMTFNPDGTIRPVTVSRRGVGPRRLNMQDF